MSHQKSADRNMSFSNLEATFEFVLPAEPDRRHWNASVILRVLGVVDLTDTCATNGRDG